MKKLSLFILILLFASCKSTKHRCDAYGFQDEDIFKEHLVSQKKYTSSEVIK